MLVEFLLDEGGTALLSLANNFGETVLHNLVSCTRVNFDSVTLMVDIGGKDLLLKENNFGRTALHLASMEEEPNKDVLLYLLAVYSTKGKERTASNRSYYQYFSILRCEWKGNMKSATEVNDLYIMNMHSPTLQQKLCSKCIEIKYLFNVSFRSKGYHKPENQINETTSY
jgi:hypothetical protein